MQRSIYKLKNDNSNLENHSIIYVWTHYTACHPPNSSSPVAEVVNPIVTVVEAADYNLKTLGDTEMIQAEHS